MADVSFEEEREYVIPKARKERPGLTAWIVYYGLAKDEKGAQRLLLVAALLAILLAAVLFLLSLRGSATLSPEERLQLERSTPLPRP